MKLRIKSFFKDYHIKIYSYHILFSYNQTNGQFTECVKNHFEKRGIKANSDEDVESLNNDKAEAMTYYLSHRTVCLRIFKHSNKSLNELIDSLSHESLHVTKEILDGIQLEFNEETEEIYAYMIGYIMNLIISDIFNE